MYPVLFRIPLDRPLNLGPLGQVSLFGFGLLLVLWSLFGIWTVVARGRSNGWKWNSQEDLSWATTWTTFAAIIALLRPGWPNSSNLKTGCPFSAMA